MKATEFLKAVAGCMPGKPSPARTSAMAQYATKLAHDTRQEMLTTDCAAAVAETLGGDFPTYPELLRAIRDAAPSMPHAPEREATEEQRLAYAWEAYIANRLGVADPAHLLSLLRAYCPPMHLREVMERLFPDALRDQDAYDAEVLRDKAVVVRRAAEMLARKMAPPAGHKGPTVHARPGPEPTTRRNVGLSQEVLDEQRRAIGVTTRARAAVEPSDPADAR